MDYKELNDRILASDDLHETRNLIGQMIKIAKDTPPGEELRKVGAHLRNCIQHGSMLNIAANKVAMFEYCTGTGKSRIPIEFAKRCNLNNILIVHWRKAHIQNWKDEIDLWGYKGNVQFTTYNSAHKYTEEQYDMVVVDECHHITENNMDSFIMLKADYFVLLSATVDPEKRLLWKSVFPGYKSYKLKLNEAFSYGILPEPKIYVKDVFLDSRDRNLVYIKHKNLGYDTAYVDFQNRHNPSFYRKNLRINCSEFEYYQCLDEDIEHLKLQFFRQKEEWAKVRWLRKGSERKAWLAKVKTRPAMQLIEDLPDKRLVVFANTIDQCEEMAGAMPTIHSEKADDEIDSNVRKFIEGDVDRLYNVGILNEGMNLGKGFDGVVIISASGKLLSNIQRSGRSVRAEQPEIYFLRVRHTRDEQNVGKFLSEFDKKFIHYI